MTKEKFEQTFGLIKGALTYDDFRNVDIVIEVSRNIIEYTTANHQLKFNGEAI